MIAAELGLKSVGSHSIGRIHNSSIINKSGESAIITKKLCCKRSDTPEISQIQLHQPCFDTRVNRFDFVERDLPFLHISYCKNNRCILLSHCLCCFQSQATARPGNNNDFFR
ncbi:hypothetical protein D3C73_1425490 [compost metagenome]